MINNWRTICTRSSATCVHTACCFIAIAPQLARQSRLRKPHRHEELKAVERNGGRELFISWKHGFESSVAELRPSVKLRASAYEPLLRSSHRCESVCHAISDQIPARQHVKEVSFFPPESALAPRWPSH